MLPKSGPETLTHSSEPYRNEDDDGGRSRSWPLVERDKNGALNEQSSRARPSRAGSIVRHQDCGVGRLRSQERDKNGALAEQSSRARPSRAGSIVRHQDCGVGRLRSHSWPQTDKDRHNNEVLSQGSGREAPAKKGTKPGTRRCLWPAVFAVIAVVISVSIAPFNSLEPPPTKRVRLHIQTLEDEGLGDGLPALPEDETPDSLAEFMKTHLTPTGVELEFSSTAANATSEANLVYVGLASPNRLDEVLFNKTQLKELGSIDAVVFIWIAPDCVDGEVPSTHREYVAEHLNVSSVAFVCWWEGFSKADFSVNSLQKLGRQLR